MTKENKQRLTWQERGYIDTRQRPERNKRRFFMLEQNDTTTRLVALARTKLAHKRGVKNDKKVLPDAEVMREALRRFIGDE